MKRLVRFLFPVGMLIGLVVSALFIVTALQTAPTTANLVPPTKNVAKANAVDPVAYGKALFVSKGCIVCHVNNRVSRLREGAMEFSDVPNLTTVKLDREYLRRWLHDPAALKPTTEMPNLGLSDEEIEALTAFLLAVKE